MTINPADPRHPYRQVADQLREAIAAGEFAADGQLPSVRTLAERYGVTLVTATRAVELLRSDGLVDTRPGLGTFVRTKKPVIRTGAYLTASPDGGRATWISEGELHGFTATQDIVEVATVPAPPEVSQRLALITDAPTVVRRRILYADGIPVQLSDSYYPSDLADGTELARPQKLRGYTIAALERLGYELDYFLDDVQPRMPTPQEVQTLRLAKGVPVVRILRTTYETGGRPIEVADMVLAGDRYVLTYRIPARG